MKIVKTSVAAAVALLLVDYLVDMVPFIGGHHPHGPHGEEGHFSTWNIVGTLGHGVVLSVVLGWRGVADAMDGVKAGATYGILVSVAHSLHHWSESGGSELVGAAIGNAIVVGVAGAAVAAAGGGSDG